MRISRFVALPFLIFSLFSPPLLTFAQTRLVVVDKDQVQAAERQLADVMEFVDTELLKKTIPEVEAASLTDSSPLAQARLGILWNEVALNFAFLNKNALKGYSEKSFKLLSTLLEDSTTPPGLVPFIASYRASSLALWGGEVGDLGKVDQAFKLFDDAVKRYSAVTYVTEFLRGSVAENVPWFFFKRPVAIADFTSIIAKAESDPSYATPKILSFSYWAWAYNHKESGFSKTTREKALIYLDRAIALDPEYQGGRTRAEKLRAEILR